MAVLPCELYRVQLKIPGTNVRLNFTHKNNKKDHMNMAPEEPPFLDTAFLFPSKISVQHYAFTAFPPFLA
jgi:hypothetical protein